MQIKYNQIVQNVRDNLRIALCISPSDIAYSQLPLYPTIFKYSSVLWFEHWPDETLEIIAKKMLEDVPGLNEKKLVDYGGFLKFVHNEMRSTTIRHLLIS